MLIQITGQKQKPELHQFMTSDFVTGICANSPFQCSSMQTIGTFQVLNMLEHLLEPKVLYLAAIAQLCGPTSFFVVEPKWTSMHAENAEYVSMNLTGDICLAGCEVAGAH